MGGWVGGWVGGWFTYRGNPGPTPTSTHPPTHPPHICRFLVKDGGFLDIRFVRIVKGKFIELIRWVWYQIRGPACWTERGGTAIFTGCQITFDFMNAIRFFGITPPMTTIQVGTVCGWVGGWVGFLFLLPSLSVA